MTGTKRIIGFVWASPVTLVGLLYAFACEKLGWYRRRGMMGDAIVWQVIIERCPSWMCSMWAKWAGQTIGNVVVLKCDPLSTAGAITLRHEQEHVRQFMITGILFYLVYYVCALAIWLTCPRSSSYYTQPFEIEARRAAGQVVDVEGTVARAKNGARMRQASWPDDRRSS